ncbi:alkylhydroperoxidase AhpD family core domain-containing protein [Alteromonadaceae bacterium Bs31]|nr:alkylhydroperoxidase AhpD family core domain-containing protein [Alteromonadaceae bacterium Bs31]
MKNFVEQKIEQSISDRKDTYQLFIENIEAYKPFLEVEDKVFSDGALNGKHKELMALSISIVTKCEPCMEWHLEQALQNGASDQEIYETIGVAIEMGGGPAAAYARFVIKALDYFKNK